MNYLRRYGGIISVATSNYAAGWTVLSSNPDSGKRFFCFPEHQNHTCPPPSPSVSFQWVLAFCPRVNHPTQLMSRVKIRRNVCLIILHVFMAWTRRSLSFMVYLAPISVAENNMKNNLE